MQNIKKEWATITAVTQGGFKEDEEYGKSVKDIEPLTLIQSQFFDCAPLLSGILKILFPHYLPVWMSCKKLLDATFIDFLQSNL